MFSKLRDMSTMELALGISIVVETKTTVKPKNSPTAEATLYTNQSLLQYHRHKRDPRNLKS